MMRWGMSLLTGDCTLCVIFIRLYTRCKYIASCAFTESCAAIVHLTKAYLLQAATKECRTVKKRNWGRSKVALYYVPNSAFYRFE